MITIHVLYFWLTRPMAAKRLSEAPAHRGDSGHAPPEYTQVCPVHTPRAPPAIGGDEAPDLTTESARALFFPPGRVRLNAG